jgi:Zn finger protein HypA/HybF involved in hydrogenase expression
MPEPVTIATLGDLHRQRYTITAWCRTCDRNQPVPLDLLIERLGAEYPYTQGLRLTCSRCRSRDVGITIHVPTGAPISRGSG